MPSLIVHPSGPLRGSVSVPGDKSVSHRALILGGIAEGDTLVRGWLAAEDCQATLRCVRALGVRVDVSERDEPGLPDVEDPAGPCRRSRRLLRDGEMLLTVHGIGMDGLREPADVLDCGGSGTTMRLMAGLLAGQPFLSVLTGNEALRRRPMGRVAEPLQRMGATILGRDAGRLPPLAIRGGNLRGIAYDMPVASAQVKSALLLAGLFAQGETALQEPGPSRDHTERMLRAFGGHLDVEGSQVWLAGGQRLRAPGPAGLVVPGDFSSAAFPLVAAAIIPHSEVWLTGVGANPTRTGLLDLLVAMGASANAETRGRGDAETGQRVSLPAAEPMTDLTIRGSQLRALEVGGDLVVRAIDEFPIFTVAATQASGTTTVREARELRVKESDRISAVVIELAKMGAAIEERPDGLVVRGPTSLTGAVVDSHRDHRLAMALAVAGLVARGRTEIRDADVINDSFPGFVETMRELGADIAWA